MTSGDRLIAHPTFRYLVATFTLDARL